MKKSFISPLRQPKTVLIKDARVVVTESGPVQNLSLYVADRTIVAMGEAASIRSEFGQAEEEIDASKCLVIPGFVNNHSHIAMTLLRGFAEDLPLLSWLRDKVWPAEAKLKPEDVYLGAVCGAAEALLSGTTSITSVYFYDSSGSEAKALDDVGMRGILAHGMFDWTREDGLKKTEEMVEKFHGKDQGRIRIATSPHAPYSCSPDLLKEIETMRIKLNQKFGRAYRVMNTLHVAEARNEAREIESKYGVNVSKGVASYLRSLGVLTDETIAAHCIHLTEDDIVSFKSTQATVASCPVSNLKVGMGVADIPKMISNGITVSLGTDGPASNNALDMFETSKMASLLPKGVQGDTTLMSARQTFEISTLGGARSMHQSDQIGSLAVGKRADLVILDLSAPHSQPFYDPYSHLLFSAKSQDVRDVLVDGRILAGNRKLLFLDTEVLQNEISRRIGELGFLNEESATH
ncbi:MAG TPA: amidohydrolase [Nitrososphaerales archaeon]|nr:amidohydrolase [Nitrososphaerales archaeon]